jgi:tetratricopeptide (TPR) repeat protein
MVAIASIDQILRNHSRGSRSNTTTAALLIVLPVVAISTASTLPTKASAAEPRQKPAATSLAAEANAPSSFLAQMLENELSHGRTYEVRRRLALMPKSKTSEEDGLLWEGACLCKEGNFETAAAVFSKVKNLSSASAFLLNLAAQSFAQSGDSDRAIVLATSAIEKKDDFRTYLLRAGCYSDKRRYVEAAADFDKAAQKHRSGANDYYCKEANALLAANKPQLALAACLKAPPVASGGGRVAPMMAKGICLARLDKWKEAADCYSSVLALAKCDKSIDSQSANMFSSNCLAERAKCYEKLGQKALARADRQALENLSQEIAHDLIGR